MSVISAIRPLSDEEAAGLVSASTLLELRESILEVPLSRRDRDTYCDEAAVRHVHRPRLGWAGMRRRGRLRLAGTGALVAAVIAFIALATSGGHLGAVHIGAQRAQALSFTRHRGEITIIVRDPLASPATFRHELTQHHLHIQLRLLDGSPSIVGTLEYVGENANSGIQAIQATGRCRLTATRDYCPVGVRVPVGYRGSVSLGFVVPTPVGTPYETSGSVTAPGEAMHGLRYVGLTVRQVLRMLQRRHIRVQSYRHTTHHGKAAYTHLLHSAQVPRTWRVFSAGGYAPHEVILFVGTNARAQGFDKAH